MFVILLNKQISVNFTIFSVLCVSELSLQHVSMFFRSEPGWEVVEPLPDIGRYLGLKKKLFVSCNPTLTSFYSKKSLP